VADDREEDVVGAVSVFLRGIGDSGLVGPPGGQVDCEQLSGREGFLGCGEGHDVRLCKASK